ncbi:Uncharacterised protein [Vibrio cholerae]|nr:Uncharacterised protein [Vibrio cholerae]
MLRGSVLRVCLAGFFLSPCREKITFAWGLITAVDVVTRRQINLR